MDAPQTIFARVAKTLEAKTWFKKEGWLVSTHPFPVKSPDAITLHIFKKHWFNDQRQGIHVESFLFLDPKKRKKSNLTVHLLHTELIPGTKLKRRELSQPVVDGIFDDVSSWGGYRFRTGKYGMQPFSIDLDGTDPDFERVLVAEASRLCRKIGPLIDKTLRAILTRSTGGQP